PHRPRSDRARCGSGARCRRAARGRRSSGRRDRRTDAATVAGSWTPLPRGEPRERLLPARAFGERVEPEDSARARKLDERDAFFVAGLEADRGAGGHGEALAERLGTFAADGPVDLEDVDVGTGLDGPGGRA